MNFEQMARELLEGGFYEVVQPTKEKPWQWLDLPSFAAAQDVQKKRIVEMLRRVVDAEAEAIQRICTDQAERKTSDFMAEYDDVAIGFQDGARLCAAKIAARRKNRSAT